MASPETQDDRLLLLFDGELAPEDEAAMRRSLPGEAEAELRAWGRLRAAMKETSSGWTEEIDSDSLFARIEAEIEAEPLLEPLEAPEEAPAPPIPLRSVPNRRERRIWAAAATGLAAAAAVALAVVSWPSRPSSPLGPAMRGSEVVAADFGGNTGTIFEVEGGAGERLAVVWIDDEEVATP